MEYKLTKTFLSKRPSELSLMTGLISLALLVLFFGASQNDLSASGHLVYEKHEYWRAFTTSLLHADLNHLAHNAFFFTGLAALLTNYFGFWVFPVLSFIAGGFINMAVLYFYPPEVTLVGVSGVIYFMASFWLTLYILIEKRQSLMVRLVHAVAVSLIFLFPEAFDPQTSYLAHGFGFLFGVPFALIYFAMNREKFKAAEVWEAKKKDFDEMENIILLEESSYRQLPPEDERPKTPSSDCAQCQQH